MKPDKTSTLLVDHLLEKPESTKRMLLIDKALRLVYDDFGSEDATPKMNLYADLNAAGYSDLAKNVIEGIYDR